MTIDQAGLTIRNMTGPQEVQLALDWAAREGWNPGLADAQAFFAADPQGFFLALAEGRPVGSISLVNYGQGYAFAGLYIVAPELRGRGVGRRLAAAAVAHAGGRVIGLDGVVAQQPAYAQLGFSHAFDSFRYQAQGGGEDPGGVVDLAGRWEQVLAYDRACFPAPREAFLRPWLRYPGGAALGVVQGGDLKGYGVLRPCQEGHKIGPLFADDEAGAERLFLALKARAGQGPVFLDAPHNNPGAVALVKRHGLTAAFQCGRMYLNGRPAWAAAKVFGITTFELG